MSKTRSVAFPDGVGIFPQRGSVGVLQFPAHIQSSLPDWHAPFSLCRVVAATRRRVKLRLLSQNTDESDEWVDLVSKRVDQSRFPLPSLLLPAVFVTQHRLSEASLEFLDQALQTVIWCGATSTGYEFGLSTHLKSDPGKDILELELTEAFMRTWGQEYWQHHRLDCTDGHFLRYQPGAPVPPWHFDIQATTNGQQCANVLIYLSDLSQGGQTLLDQGRVEIAPVRGECVLWRSYTDSGVLDPRAMHSAAPVIVGTKLALCICVRRPWSV